MKKQVQEYVSKEYYSNGFKIIEKTPILTKEERDRRAIEIIRLIHSISSKPPKTFDTKVK